MTGLGECCVTGVTSGLGAHAAANLADRGWRVTGIGRKPPGHSDVPAGIDYIQADLGNPDDVAALPSRLQACPSFLIHCAVAYPGGKAEGTEDFEHVFRVNALAPYRLTRDLMALKPQGHFASFVMVNSEAMFNADENSGVYAASKAALKVLASGLAHACRGRNASVSTLLLGPLANPSKRRELESVSQRRGLSAQEVTRMFLRRSNPNLVIDDLIEFDACLTALECIYELGASANGMVCRLDGGAGGSLI